MAGPTQHTGGHCRPDRCISSSTPVHPGPHMPPSIPDHAAKEGRNPRTGPTPRRPTHEGRRPGPSAAAFTELLQDQRRVLGTDHPHTLKAREAPALWRKRSSESSDING